jgi:methyltransferase-like protein
LTNLELLDRDILTLDGSLGKFDYIICHGVFSWTTDEVREKILAVCDSHLSPNGIAYINYNTYPGWHLQSWTRDMIRTRALMFEGVDVQVREARATIDILITEFQKQQRTHDVLLLGELESIKRYSDRFLYHAILNFQNQAFYLNEFVTRCESHSLQYIGDAEPMLGWSGSLAQGTAAQLDRMCQSPIEFEQHVDFINNTSSRRSLLCHNSVSTNRDGQTAGLSGLHVASMLRLASDADTASLTIFENSSGHKITTRNPGLCAALTAIANSWPASVSFDLLATEVGSDLATWEPDLLHCYMAGMIELTLRPSQCNRNVTDNPMATRLARWQAANQDFVTNMRHQTVRLDANLSGILTLIDGTRTVTELATLSNSDKATTIQRLNHLVQHSLVGVLNE